MQLNDQVRRILRCSPLFVYEMGEKSLAVLGDIHYYKKGRYTNVWVIELSNMVNIGVFSELSCRGLPPKYDCIS